MTIPAQQCDLRQLEKLIEQDLSDAETRSLEQHLSDCPTCQKQLEQLVGSSMFWQKTESRLSPEQFIQSLFECPAPSSSARTEGTQPNVTTSDASALRYVAQWLAPTDDPHSMGRLGNYEVMGLIGIGGMGIVVKAFDPALNRSVAIKLLSPHLSLNGSARQRFAREAKAAAAVAHENVLSIHAIELQQDVPYLVMPYIKGASLAKRLRHEGALPLIDLLRIAHQIALGLAAAHAQGLVHRDVKPANILMAQGSERLKVSDFGLARAADDASLTRSGTITGTPLYMSPEQARGEPVDQRSDIFSFGSLLYEACTGHPPFRAETPFGILRRIGEDMPRPIQESRPEVPAWLCGLIEAMMQKSPADRNLTAEQLAERFRIGLAYLQQPAGSPLPDALAPFVRVTDRKPATPWLPFATVVVLATTVCLAIGLGPLISSNQREPVTKFTPANLDSRVTKTDPQVSPPHDIAASAPLAIDNGPAPSQSTPPPVATSTSTETSPPASTATSELTPNSSSLVDPTSIIENPTVNESLRYAFSQDEMIGYKIDLNLQRDDGSLTIDGQILLQVDAVHDDSFEFKYLLSLNYQRLDSMLMVSPFSVSSLEGEIAQLQRCERNGRIKIGKDGRILGRSRQSELPAQLGPIAEFLFPRLPNDKDKHFQTKSSLCVHSIATAMMRAPVGTTPGMDLDRVTKTSARRAATSQDNEEKNQLLGFKIRLLDKIKMDDNLLSVKTIGNCQFAPKRHRVDSLRLERTLDKDSLTANFANLTFELNSIPSDKLPKTIDQHEDEQ